MTAADLLMSIGKLNLAAAAAILLVLALRAAARTAIGARLTYALWLLPPVAMLAVLAPARRIVATVESAPVTDALIGSRAGLSTEHLMGLSPPGLDLAAIILVLWISGAALAFAAMARTQRRFMAVAAEGAIGPAVVGLISPRIIIPDDFAKRFEADEQALILAHEQMHIRRQDLRLNGLASAIGCLFWFNPIIRMANRALRIDQELACDEAVLSRFPHAQNAYARALVKSQLARHALPLGCYWPSSPEHPFLERIARLKAGHIGKGRRRAAVGGLAVLCLAWGLATWSSMPPRVVYRIAMPLPPVGTPFSMTAPLEAAESHAERRPALNRRTAAPAPARTSVCPDACSDEPTVERVSYVGAAPIPISPPWTRYFDQNKRVAIAGHVVDVRFGEGARAEYIVEHDEEGRKTRFRVAVSPPEYLVPTWRSEMGRALGSTVHIRGYQAYDTSCDGGCLMLGIVTTVDPTDVT